MGKGESLHQHGEGLAPRSFKKTDEIYITLAESEQNVLQGADDNVKKKKILYDA